MTTPVAVAGAPDRSRSWAPALGFWRLRRAPATLGGACVAAWAVLVGAEVSGLSRYLHHDAVLEDGATAWSGSLVLLGGWVVMCAAMMLPATLPAARQLRGRSGDPSAVVMGAFLGGFLAVWGVAGGVLLGIDGVVHRVVESMPALSARPWLVGAALLGGAGILQLAPGRQRWLSMPGPTEAVPETPRAGLTMGGSHAARCLRADGPLVLVMFAAGGRLAWMALLTAVMVGERSARSGRQVAGAVGVTLLVAAALVVLDPSWVPAPFDDVA